MQFTKVYLIILAIFAIFLPILTAGNELIDHTGRLDRKLSEYAENFNQFVSNTVPSEENLKVLSTMTLKAIDTLVDAIDFSLEPAKDDLELFFKTELRSIAIKEAAVLRARLNDLDSLSKRLAEQEKRSTQNAKWLKTFEL